MMLTVADVENAADLIKSADIFHLGTLSMTDEPAKAATIRAVEIARENGVTISFDPNYREPLWKSESDALEVMKFGFENCDILKISDNEIQLFTGIKDIEEGAKKIKKDYDIPIVFATLGPDGSIALYKDIAVKKDGYRNPATIETTGAGDTFCACAIDYIHKKGLDNLTEEGLIKCLSFANAAASIITTRKGALSVMPTKEEVMSFLENNH
jgi:fructokinase